MNKKNIAKLDKELILKGKHRSAYSNRIAEVFHHVIGRRNLRLRWDKKNLMPLTNEEHRLLHDGKISVNWKYVDYLMEAKNELLKDYCIGLTEEEFTKQKLNELREWN